MKLKVLLISLVVSIAALSPAPIKDMEGAKHLIPTHTAAQAEALQKYNGTVGVVGTVLQKTNSDGTGPDMKDDAKASAVVASAVTPEAQANALKNLTTAQTKLALENEHGMSPIVIGLIVLAIVGGILFAAKTYLEKIGPAPKSFHPAEKARF